jgi:tRNA-specific adenosine deaminase 3
MESSNSAIRRLLPNDGGIDLQHLRRFAKVGDVPNVVIQAFEIARVGAVVDLKAPALRDSSAAGRNLCDGAEDLSSFTSSVHALRNEAGDPETERGNPMVGQIDVMSSESQSTQESTTTTLKDLFSNSNSPSAQGHILREPPKSKHITESTQVNPTAILNKDAASNSNHSDSRVKLDETASKDLFLIVGSTNAISSTAVVHELSAVVSDPIIFSIQVPRLAPTSQEQASSWSAKYWPTVYKKSNPFGPHPSIVSRSEQEIQGEVGEWMALAAKAALQADLMDSGEAVGVVIVERKNGVGRPVAVAGDARWIDWPCQRQGNVTAHAVLRAIAMVATGLRETEQFASIASEPTRSLVAERVPADQSMCTASPPNQQLEIEKTAEEVIKPAVESSSLDSEEDIWNPKPDPEVTSVSAPREKRVNSDNIFQDRPILTSEKYHNNQSGTEAGYLCHELEIYCSHEPCVMCSMAILHSRFGKTVFQNRMPKTGGMCADGELGHGLFWRKELNWTLLAWQWIPQRDDGKVERADLHA